MTEQVTILGATGSIGRNTLDVISRHPERFQVWGLSAQSRVEKLAGIAVESGAKAVSIGAGRTDDPVSQSPGFRNVHAMPRLRFCCRVSEL